MLRRLFDTALNERAFVLLAAVLLIVAGVYAVSRLPIDAVPDVTNVQVQVLTKSPALGPEEVEQFLTYPVEAAMNGLPKLKEIRSISRYGISAVTVVFDDSMDIYLARQLVAERLVSARESIPSGFGEPERDNHQNASLRQVVCIVEHGAAGIASVGDRRRCPSVGAVRHDDHQRGAFGDPGSRSAGGVAGLDAVA